MTGAALAVLQARMGSTRLPGKTLRRVLGKTLLEHCVGGIRHARTVGTIVVATTTELADDVLEAEALGLQLHVFRGSSSDVLDRFRGVVAEFPGDPIVRLTADCPLMDGGVIDRTVRALTDSGAEYASTGLSRSYPRGLDVEAFTRAAFTRVLAESSAPYHHEHVTPYFYEEPGRFKTLAVAFERDLSSWRLTVDTPQDLEVVSRVLEGLAASGQPRELASVIRFLEARPEILALNRDVRQKSFREVG